MILSDTTGKKCAFCTCLLVGELSVLYEALITVFNRYQLLLCYMRLKVEVSLLYS